MIPLSSHTRVYLALGATDMRKEINGLSVLVEAAFLLDPFSGHLFVLCNRQRTTIKVLYWDRNGFCLWQKRLEKHRFKWPQRSLVIQMDRLCVIICVRSCIDPVRCIFAFAQREDSYLSTDKQSSELYPPLNPS